MKIAFLIIDMQPTHLQDVEKLKIDNACEYINYVAGFLRSKNHCVIHVRDIEGAADTSSEPFGIIPEVDVQPSDIQITKTSSNAFWNTELEQILRDREVGLVVVAGNAAEHCVLFTYNGAIERGFQTVMLQNGILSSKSDVIPSTYRDRNLISHPVIKFMVQHT